MKKILVFSALVCVMQITQADPMGRPPSGHHQPPTVEQRVERMTKQLSLNEDQAAQITAIFTSHEPEREDLVARLKALHEQERELIDAVLTDEQKELIASKHHKGPKKH